MGRETRTIPPAIRRALQARDPGCQVPSCSHTRYLEGHHVEHWADGGETKLSNLMHLCTFHHRLVHQGELHVSLDASGEVTFRGVDGTKIVPVPPLPGVDATAETLEQQNEAQGLQIRQHTLGLWDGIAPDYSWGVELLWHRRKGEN